MQTIVVDRKGARLSLDGQRMRVDAPGERPWFAPLARVERVVITARVEIASNLIAALGAHGASVVVLSGRDHRRVAQFLPPAGKDAEARLAQMRAVLNAGFRLAIARRLVRAKLARQMNTLARLGARGPAVRSALRALAEARLAARRARDPDALRVLEAGAARAYFAALAEAAPPRFGFSVRTRRPPRDPLNALLSLGYTLLHADAVRAAHAAALDPMLGVYHAPTHGRESLACDLIEPLRPEVDAFVWRLARTGAIRPEHFGEQQGAVLLGKAGRGRFYEAWDEAARPWRRALWRMSLAFKQAARRWAC